MSSFASFSTSLPSVPANLSACGLPTCVLEDLVLKHLHPRGTTTLDVLAREIRLPLTVIQELLGGLQSNQYVTALPPTDGENTASCPVTLTAIGRRRACDAFAVSRYLGPAPVSVSDYVDQCRRQRWDGSGISHEDLLSALNGVSLEEETLSDVQLALTTGGSLLLSGASGNGKTLLANRLGQLIEQSCEAVHVPYAIWADGVFVRIFDPQVHHPLDEANQGNVVAGESDLRWRRVRRPVIKVSTELSRDSFELPKADPASTLVAPFHVLANGGMLILDDLGRQAGSFTELMNRWLMPLEQQADTLTLPTGKRLNLPVDAWVVLAAGEDSPSLPSPVSRRIRCRVQLPIPDRDRFATLLLEAGRKSRIEVDESGVEELFLHCYNPQNPPKCSDPQNLLQAVESICRIQKETVRARADLLLSAAKRLGLDGERRAA